MKFVVQRVTDASVSVDEKIVGKIGQGYLVLIGICDTDTKELADKMLQKLLKLRINNDADDKTNLSIQDIQGSLLLVSQFTLYADCKKGNRPSFVNAGSPEHANDLYEYLIMECQKTDLNVAHGVFGAHMKVELCNDGPFTVVMDSKELFSDF